MKFHGSNLDKWRVNAQINEFYRLQNMDSTSAMSNTTEVIGELLLENHYLTCTSKINFVKEHYANCLFCCPTACDISTKCLSFNNSFLSENPILI